MATARKGSAVAKENSRNDSVSLSSSARRMRTIVLIPGRIGSLRISTYEALSVRDRRSISLKVKSFLVSHRDLSDPTPGKGRNSSDTMFARAFGSSGSAKVSVMLFTCSSPSALSDGSVETGASIRVKSAVLFLSTVQMKRDSDGQGSEGWNWSVLPSIQRYAPGWSVSTVTYFLGWSSGPPSFRPRSREKKIVTGSQRRRKCSGITVVSEANSGRIFVAVCRDSAWATTGAARISRDRSVPERPLGMVALLGKSLCR